MTPDPVSDEELLIFVGYSRDAKELANRIVEMQPALQRYLSDCKKLVRACPFSVVKVWVWQNDANDPGHGQKEVIDPYLNRCHIAAFVFKERVGQGTWGELRDANNRKPAIPVLPFFPAQLPPFEIMNTPQGSKNWQELIEKRESLTADWFGTEYQPSNSVTPRDVYRDASHFSEIAYKQLEIRILSIVQGFSISVKLPPMTLEPPVTAEKTWLVYDEHVLHPAFQFEGRSDILQDLNAWTLSGSVEDRVRSLIAPGGTGKTALVERLMHGLPRANPFGVFVWSFEQNPKIEAFFSEAYAYLFGEDAHAHGSYQERLISALQNDPRSHLFILDGIEAVQSPEDADQKRWAMEDPLLKIFLIRLTRSLHIRSKLLITGRFPLQDLETWRGSKYRAILLEDLDAPAARGILRNRKVSGTDNELDNLTKKVHRHALTVDVLGLYLARFEDGKIRNVDQFNLSSFGREQKAERLNAVLKSYADRLPLIERDVLSRLSLFPTGTTMTDLEVMKQTAGEVAGALAAVEIHKLHSTLIDLMELGLAFRYGQDEQITFAAHPFLREFFGNLIDDDFKFKIFEAILDSLVKRVAIPPKHEDISPAVLDQVDRIIEVAILAGEIGLAWDYYSEVLGGYKHLGSMLCEFSRGLRITSALVQHYLQPGKSKHNLAQLYSDRGLYSRDLGDLTEAQKAFQEEWKIRKSEKLNMPKMSAAANHQASIAMLSGHFYTALISSKDAMNYLHESFNKRQLGRAGTVNNNFFVVQHAYFADLSELTGNIADAREHFQTALKRKAQPPLLGVAGSLHAAHFLRRGFKEKAKAILKACITKARKESELRIEKCCETQMAHCMLPGQVSEAQAYLDSARAYAVQTGDIEITLRCYLLHVQITHAEQSFTQSTEIAHEGIQLADSTGFGRWSLDLRIALAVAYLAGGKADLAILELLWVIERSQQRKSRYAWGLADSHHFLAVAYKSLGKHDEALESIRQASVIRTSLEHPERAETERLIKEWDV